MIDYIGIIHEERQTDRKRFLDSILCTINLPHKFYRFPNRNYFVNNKQIGFMYSKDNIGVRNRFFECFEYYPNPLLDGEIAAYLCTYFAYIDCLNSPFDTFLMLEDDAIINDNTLNVINEFLDIIPKDWDVICPGNGCGLSYRNVAHQKINDNIYKITDKKRNRCLDSIIYNKRSLGKIVAEMGMFCGPVDCEVASILNKLNLNVYWIEPPIIIQGSQNNTYTSCIR